MCSSEEKQNLCETHHDLLHLVYRYGNGAMLLPQLRALAVRLELYPSEQAVGRAVRLLRDTGIIKRMTWLDGRSDLLIAYKYLYRYMSGACNSQQVAAAKKYNSPRQYMVRCCQVDYLIRILDAYPKELKDLDTVERYLHRIGSTLFLHAPDLAACFADYPAYSQYNKSEFAAQLAELKRLAALRSRLNAPETAAPPPPLVPVLTLDALHKRNIYVAKITRSTIILIRYDYSNSLTASRVMDWALDAYSIFHPLLPDREISYRVQSLNELGQADLAAQLAAPYHGLPYQEARLAAQHIDSGLSITVQNSDVMGRWLGGVHVLI